VSAGNLARGLVLPPEVRSIIIAVDNDRAGQDAAVAAALRWSREKRRVRLARPNAEGCDLNDVLMAKS
jgi:putative DNA primase/helicase